MSMTDRCKFGSGILCVQPDSNGHSCWSNLAAEAARTQNSRPHRKRMRCSTVRLYREGRGCLSNPKAATVSSSNTQIDTASPVFQQWHAVKAVEANLGDRTLSRAVIKRPVEGTERVDCVISECERRSEAVCEVGPVRSIVEAADSITAAEKRDRTQCTAMMDSEETHSREGRWL